MSLVVGCWLLAIGVGHKKTARAKNGTGGFEFVLKFKSLLCSQ